MNPLFHKNTPIFKILHPFLQTYFIHLFTFIIYAQNLSPYAILYLRNISNFRKQPSPPISKETLCAHLNYGCLPELFKTTN